MILSKLGWSADFCTIDNSLKTTFLSDIWNSMTSEIPWTVFVASDSSTCLSIIVAALLLLDSKLQLKSSVKYPARMNFFPLALYLPYWIWARTCTKALAPSTCKYTKLDSASWTISSKVLVFGQLLANSLFWIKENAMVLSAHSSSRVPLSTCNVVQAISTSPQFVRSPLAYH